MAYLNNRYDSIHTTTTVVLYLSTQLLDLYLSIQFLCLYQDNCCAIIQIPVVPLSKTTIVTLYWQMSMLLPIETAIITLYWRLLSLYLTRQLLWFHPDSYYDFIQTAIMISSRLLLWFHPDYYYDFIQTVIMISSRQVLYLYTDNYCTFTYPYMLWLHPDRCYDFIQITVVSFRDDDARQSPVRPVLRSLLEPHGRLRQKVRQDPEEGKRLGS